MHSRAPGLPTGLLQERQDPPAAKLKARFHPGKEIPEQKTECSARLPREARHLESAALHCCGLENQHLAQLHFKVELWRALWAKESELLETGHTVPLNLPSKFSVSGFVSKKKVTQLPTQQEGRTVVFKDDKYIVGVLRAHLAQGAIHKAVSLPQLKTHVRKQAWRAPTVSHRSALQAQAAATLHIWHGDGRLGPAGCVESSSP